MTTTQTGEKSLRVLAARKAAAGWKAEREAAKLELQQRRFQAAAVDRTTSDWVLSPITTNEDIRSNLKRLVERSRDLAKNNSGYRRWLSMRQRNIIGPQGFLLQAKVWNEPQAGIPERPDKMANEILEANWYAWGTQTAQACTVDGRHSWHSLCTLVDRAHAVDGEAFVRVLRGNYNQWGLTLQPIDATLIDVDLNVPAGNGQNEIIMGVERDAWGRPVAYHVLAADYYNRTYTTDKYVRIPAADMIHVFTPEFVGQVRGFPPAAAAIQDMNMAAGYREAVLINARTAACNMGIWERPVNASGKITFDNPGDAENKATMDMEPGRFAIAPKGWTFKSLTPSNAPGAVGDFLKVIERSIASGLDVNYNDFANDLEGVNFSSLRYGALCERDSWKMEQAAFIEGFCRFVWRAWLEQFLLSGRSVLPFSKVDKFDAVVFIPRRWDWVDPLRDIKADREAVDMRVLAPQDIIREAGRDPDEVLEEIAAWGEKLKNYGLEILPAAAPAVDAPNKNKGGEKGNQQE